MTFKFFNIQKEFNLRILGSPKWITKKSFCLVSPFFNAVGKSHRKVRNMISSKRERERITRDNY